MAKLANARILPSDDKAISVTGIIGILLSGVFPGLLVFIGGRKAKRQAEAAVAIL